MARPEHTPRLALLEEAVTVLFSRIEDVYYRLNPRGGRYASLKQLSDSEVLALALFQQSSGAYRVRTLLLLREVARFFSDLFPGIVGLWPSSFHRRVRKLRRYYFEPLGGAILPELCSESPRPSSSTRPCFGCCIRARFPSRRGSRGRRG